MLEHVLGDNPPPEQQIAIIANSLSNFITSTNTKQAELLDSQKDLIKVVEQLRLLQREQNGNVAKAFERISNHDKWHGENDNNIGQRLGVLEDDKKNRAQFWKFLKQEWAVASLLGGTLLTLGAAIGKLGNLFGWW